MRKRRLLDLALALLLPTAACGGDPGSAGLPPDLPAGGKADGWISAVGQPCGVADATHPSYPSLHCLFARDMAGVAWKWTAVRGQGSWCNHQDGTWRCDEGLSCRADGPTAARTCRAGAGPIEPPVAPDPTDPDPTDPDPTDPDPTEPPDVTIPVEPSPGLPCDSQLATHTVTYLDPLTERTYPLRCLHSLDAQGSLRALWSLRRPANEVCDHAIGIFGCGDGLTCRPVAGVKRCAEGTSAAPSLGEPCSYLDPAYSIPATGERILCLYSRVDADHWRYAWSMRRDGGSYCIHRYGVLGCAPGLDCLAGACQ